MFHALVFFLLFQGQSPVRVVSLAPSLSETVCALGGSGQLIGVTDYCLYPVELKNKTRIGGYLNPNLERITALQPDLVLALPEHRDVIEKLKRLGLRVESIKNWSVEDVYRSITSVGSLIGRDRKARELASRLRTRTAKLNHARPKKLRCLLVLGSMGPGEQEMKEFYLVGRNGFLNELLTLAGGENAWRQSQPYFPKVGQEALLELNPDVIIELVPQSELSDAEIKRRHKLWADLPFLEAGRKHYHLIHADHVLQAGPRYVETLEQLSKILDTP
jgi:iron complex transport system substrate-binding protein